MNHLDLVGWINAARYKWAEFTGREIKFKPATFYLGVADHLARQVEGQTRDAGTDEPINGGSSTAGEAIEGLASEHSRAGAGVKTTEGAGNCGPPIPDRTPSPAPASGSDAGSSAQLTHRRSKSTSRDECS